MGLMTVAILVVNNIRDIESDRQANKRTMAVRFGKQIARLEYGVCLLGAYIIPVALWGAGKLPLLSLLRGNRLFVTGYMLVTCFLKAKKCLNEKAI